MANILPSDKRAPLSVTPVDRKGNPTTTDSVPVWASSDPAIVEITDVSDDGLSCRAKAVGPAGTAQVSVRADAARGPDIREIIGTVDFEVVAAEAVSMNIAVGALEDQE